MATFKERMAAAVESKVGVFATVLCEDLGPDPSEAAIKFSIQSTQIALFKALEGNAYALRKAGFVDAAVGLELQNCSRELGRATKRALISQWNSGE